MSKKTQLITLLLVVIAVLSLLLGQAYYGADESVDTDPVHAEVIKTRGQVSKISSLGGRVSDLQPGSALFLGDSVQTGENSAATILFADNSKMLMSENSRISMLELLKSKTGDAVMTEVEVTAGSVESRVTKKKSFDAKYEVRTPSMHMAVRGTVFVVKVDSETGKTASSVLEGKVLATAADRTVTLPAGFGTVAMVGKAPAAASVLLVAPTLDTLPATSTRLPLHLSWQPLADSSGYRVQIFDGASGESLLHDQVYTGTSADLGRLPDADYILRISGVSTSGLEGKYVEQPFTLAARPVPPVASWPISTQSPSTKKVKFRWASANGAGSYIFQVSDREDFSTIISEVDNLPGRMKGISLMLAPGNYFWRVASVTKSKHRGPFSDPYSFSVVESGK